MNMLKTFKDGLDGIMSRILKQVVVIANKIKSQEIPLTNDLDQFKGPIRPSRKIIQKGYRIRCCPGTTWTPNQRYKRKIF